MRTFQQNGTIHPSPSPEEAAAIVAAIERFMRASAPPATADPTEPEGWLKAARIEAVSVEPGDEFRNPWINT